MFRHREAVVVSALLARRGPCTEEVRLYFLEEADAGPGATARGLLRFRQVSEQSEEERRPFQLRGGPQDSFHFQRLPATRFEKVWPFRRRKFEGRAHLAEMLAGRFLHHF